MKELTIFKKLTISISDEDWDFLCKYRFFTETPSDELVQSEFVSGTGITEKKAYTWSFANEKFIEYINDLKEILNISTLKTF